MMKRIALKITILLLLCVNTFASNYDQKIISDKKCKIYDDIDYLSDVGFSFSSGDFKITTRKLGKLSCEFALLKEILEEEDLTQRECHCYIDTDLNEEDIALIFEEFLSNWDEEKDVWKHPLKSAKIEIKKGDISNSIILHIGPLKLLNANDGKFTIEYP